MRYVAIHAHLYQPPRENPWLDAIESQPSARPFHDWNERIAFECYGPNSASRILDEEDRVLTITNNYERLSFNAGPTLAAWLSRHAYATLARMVEGDRLAAEARGHGGALAQPYAHPILPLCTRREKRLQVLWGLQDFEHRFGHKAEGIWLPETAADLETFEVLAELGVRFTLLAPHQADRVRGRGGGDWTKVGPEGPDTGVGYRQELSGGRGLDLLFYRRDVSQAVAFEGLLSDGHLFADRLRSPLAGTPEQEPRLVLVATDGESYGHHHRFGDMALAVALETLDRDPETTLTSPGAFLEAHPPSRLVELAENTSWSCAHGIERWRSNCGCRAGAGAERGPAQQWRGPLREALNRLRDGLEEFYERCGRALFADAEAAAEDYGKVVAARTDAVTESFLDGHLKTPEKREDRLQAARLLEMQRHALLMFASCGWFFDRLDGLEPVQILRHASRALGLARSLGGPDLEPTLLDELAAAPGPSRRLPDGRAVWERLVRPAAVSPLRAAAHYGVIRIFGKHPELLRQGFALEGEDLPLERAGAARLARGRVRVRDRLTGESARVGYAVLHAGGREVDGGAHLASGEDPLPPEAAGIAEAFARSDLVEAGRRLNEEFPGGTFGTGDLLPDLRSEILESVTEEALERLEAYGREVHRDFRGLLLSYRDEDREPPRPLHALAGFVLERELGREARRVAVGARPGGLLTVLAEARASGLELDASEAGETLRRALEESLALLGESEGASGSALIRALSLLEVVEALPSRPSLWEARNRVHRAFGPPPAGGGLGAGSELRDRMRLAYRLGFGLTWFRSAGAPEKLLAEVREEIEAERNES